MEVRPSHRPPCQRPLPPAPPAGRPAGARRIAPMTRLIPVLIIALAIGSLWAEPPVADRPAPQVPAGSPAAKLPPAKAGAVDFAKDVQPIFAARCLNCH